MIDSLSAVSSSPRMETSRPLAAAEHMDAQNMPNQDDAAGKQDFAAMMRSPSIDNVASLAPGMPGVAPSMLERFAATQKGNMQQLFESSRDLMKASPSMSMAEIMAHGNEFTMNMALTTTQFTLATTVGKSAGKGIDTLMKNQ